MRVKPGITCLWQIGGRANIDFVGQVALDRQYVRDQSIVLDLWILLRTPYAVLCGEGAY
ncbi:partial O-antigen biosynthesis protein WbqP [Methylocystis bryophila]